MSALVFPLPQIVPGERAGGRVGKEPKLAGEQAGYRGLADPPSVPVVLLGSAQQPHLSQTGLSHRMPMSIEPGGRAKEETFLLCNIFSGRR